MITFSSPEDITLVHYIELILIGPGEHEILTNVHLLVRFVCQGQETNLRFEGLQPP